jgi:cytoskeletal protein CcmA (bactofilin family)
VRLEKEWTNMNDPKKPPLPTAAVAAATEKRTLVDEGTGFKGTMTSTCPIVVRGSIEGEISGPSVTVSSTGAVSGKIATGTLKSEGKISGEFDVETAEVAGAVANKTVVRASTLDVKLTVPTGKMELTFGPAGSRGLS